MYTLKKWHSCRSIAPTRSFSLLPKTICRIKKKIGPFVSFHMKICRNNSECVTLAKVNMKCVMVKGMCLRLCTKSKNHKWNIEHDNLVFGECRRMERWVVGCPKTLKANVCKITNSLYFCCAEVVCHKWNMSIMLVV